MRKRETKMRITALTRKNDGKDGYGERMCMRNKRGLRGGSGESEILLKRDVNGGEKYEAQGRDMNRTGEINKENEYKRRKHEEACEVFKGYQ